MAMWAWRFQGRFMDRLLAFEGRSAIFLICKVWAVFSVPGVDILATGAHKAQLILLKNRELLERVKGTERTSNYGAWRGIFGFTIHHAIQTTEG